MTIGQSELVQRIRWHLGDKPWETTGGADDAVSVIDVEEADEWSKGNIGEFEDGDTFYVRTPNTAANTLTASRGYYGSTAAAHSANSRVLKDPKYNFSEITNAISEVIEFELPWPKYYVVTSDVTFTPDPENTTWYELNSDTLGLVRVTQIKQDGIGHVTYNTRHQWDRIVFQQGIDPLLVPSRVGIRFIDGFNNLDNDITVYSAARITDATVTGDYQDFSAGDPITAAIEYGAVALLQGSLELRKPRHSADETDYLKGAAVFDGLRKKALWTAEKKLRQESPLMDGWSRAS